MDNFKIVRDNFLKELKKASTGQSSSLPYHKTSLSPSIIDNDEEFQVMVIGGTNCSEALVKKDLNGVHILKKSKVKEFPLFKTGDDVLTLIFKNLRPNIIKIALNFTYPMEPIIRNGKVDGILNEETKGHRFSDLLGHPVGLKIENYIKEKTGKDVDVAVANDTICLVLAGLSGAASDKVVGAIIGTGYNLGFFHNESTIVNLEAGRFDDFTPSESGEKVIENVPYSSSRKYEIEIAGNYLYRHFNYYIKKKNIDYKKIESTIELFNLAFDKNKNDIINKLALEIVESSSRFVASQLAGIAEFKNSEIDVILEGGLSTDDYIVLLKKNVILLTDHFVNFVRISNSEIIGGTYLL